jgi:PAS domain S-box-containing protein
MLRALNSSGQSRSEIHKQVESLNKLLDLDLAIISESYEYHRLQAEKQEVRERSEQKFRNLVEAAACMIVLLNDDFRVLYFSPFAERLTGYSHDEVEQQSFVELFAVPGPVATSKHDWPQAVEHLPVSDLNLPIRCRDGSLRWLTWNILRLHDFDGRPAVLAVGHDITEKRRADEQLVRAERLAAIGQTIAGIAHESRNALQRIHSCSEMLEFEVEGNAQAMQLLGRLHEAQDDLARLFDEVRDFAAPITLELSHCQLPSVWREAWGLVQPDCRGREVSLVEQLEESALDVSVDRFRLVQVFRNLFENSLAACEDPVRIHIVGPAHAADDPCLELRVRDNGPGLDPRARREVFDPFFTTKSKGTGLGMAIAQRILAAHGGSIEVGDPGWPGAEFVMKLPRLTANQATRSCEAGR